MKWPGFLLLSLTILYINSCHKNSSPTYVPKIVCILYDISGSTDQPEVRRTYIAATRQILSSMRGGDAVVAPLITEKSISELRYAFFETFPIFKPTTDNPLFVKAEKRKYEKLIANKRDSLLTIASDLLSDPKQKTPRTEIFSALHRAEQIFKQTDNFPQSRKILVIMSDMIEESTYANFAKEKLLPKRIVQIIEREKQLNRLPDLNGAKVYVIGAYHPNSKKYFEIRQFWLQYFQECGAMLTKERYGATLLGFEE